MICFKNYAIGLTSMLQATSKQLFHTGTRASLSTTGVALGKTKVWGPHALYVAHL